MALSYWGCSLLFLAYWIFYHEIVLNFVKCFFCNWDYHVGFFPSFFLSVFLFFFFFAIQCGLWDLSSLTRSWQWKLCHVKWFFLYAVESSWLVFCLRFLHQPSGILVCRFPFLYCLLIMCLSGFCIWLCWSHRII